MSVISEEGPRPGRHEATNKTDELISALETARRKAELHDSQGSVELSQTPETALETARSIRADFATRGLTEAKWKKITWILDFLLKLYSSINCKFPGRIRDDHWVNHKALAQ